MSDESTPKPEAQAETPAAASANESTPARKAPAKAKAPGASKAPAKAASAEGAPAEASAPKEKAAKPAAPAAAAPAPAAAGGELSLTEMPLDPNLMEKPKTGKSKKAKNVTSGIAHVLATFNNTIVCITDLSGNVLSWASAGKCGFRGSKKATAYVGNVVAHRAGFDAMQASSLREVRVRVKGPGTGRESAVRALQAIGLEITSITDVTPLPHNGCRPRKSRRV